VIFTFNRYLQPAWKFNVEPTESAQFSTCHYHPEWLPLQEDIALPQDQHFKTEAARNADVGYRAWNRGVLTWADKEAVTKIISLPKATLRDEYAFTFKYGGKHWATYVLLRRLLSLHNPFAELAAYSKGLNIKRYIRTVDPIKRDGYHAFKSPLVAQAPFISVIIPTLNRYEYLRDVLVDLEKQDYKNFEVIIVDQSEPFDGLFYKQFKLNLQVVHQKEKLLWTARNNAVKLSTAEYLLFFDDDSRVDPDWITQHLKSLDYFNVEMSAGVSLAVIGAKVPESYNYFRWADQFDSGNALVKRDVFRKIGMFDLNFNKQSMGDGEFGIRAYLNGVRSISNPYAKRIHLKVAAGGLREIGHWDGFRPKKWFAPKPIPSVVYLFKRHYPKKLYREAILLGMMLSNVSFKNKRKNNMLLLSIFLMVVKSPLLFIQFMKSKRRADAMLAGGDKIEYLT
jgi:GT2 family glycosyltransferase